VKRISKSNHLVTQIEQNTQQGSAGKQPKHLGKFLWLLLIYLSPRPQITFKWKLRHAGFCGTKTPKQRSTGGLSTGAPNSHNLHTYGTDKSVKWVIMSFTLNPMIFTVFWHMHICYLYIRGYSWFKMTLVIFGVFYEGWNWPRWVTYMCCVCPVLWTELWIWGMILVCLNGMMLKGDFLEFNGEI